MSDFENTPVLVGRQPTTYGEMRKHAQDTLTSVTPAEVKRAAVVNPELLSGAMQGMATVISFLLDRLEEATDREEATS